MQCIKSLHISLGTIGESPRTLPTPLGVLLLTWNQAFYRYASFDFNDLEQCLTKNMPLIEQYRNRDIYSYNRNDDDSITKLFAEMLNALKTERGKSPVAVAKALHLLAPNFFPLWDIEIARGHECLWSQSSEAASKYLCFMKKSQTQIEEILTSYGGLQPQDRQTALTAICKNCSSNLPFIKSILKIIDEYNYAKYTKNWI
jgi:hypothetical protein